MVGISRRGILIVGGAAAVAAASRYVPGWLPQRFDFAAMADPPGFRRLAGGAVSSAGAGGFDVLIGLERSAPAPPPLSPGALCPALFGAAAAAPGRVRIASFSDYFCPYCRVLTGRLAAIAADDSRVTVAWHEVPLLGRASVDAARAALAADLQGAYPAFQARLLSTPFQPTTGFLRRMAGDLGLDADRLLADMDGAAVDRRLREAAAMFAQFGFVGTPGLVVGRTAVSGAVDAPRLRALIDLEAREPAACA